MLSDRVGECYKEGKTQYLHEREEEIARRQRDGRKPFYLTLDSDGKPYGLGKPAWIKEISKLAIGLDPSCTHIKHQSYEAVTTFKARLNERFEYSGILSDDYLRSCMGKAVTAKRRELVRLIREGGRQPLHVDHAVWERLIKLQGSKQYEERSEQAKHANASRKTYGRTGSRGVNGVREILREIFNRSPDPDEMERELQRDKGYGGYKKKEYKDGVGEEKVYKQALSQDNSTGSQSMGADSKDNSREDMIRHSENLTSSVEKVGATDADNELLNEESKVVVVWFLGATDMVPDVE